MFAGVNKGHRRIRSCARAKVGRNEACPAVSGKSTNTATVSWTESHDGTADPSPASSLETASARHQISRSPRFGGGRTGGGRPRPPPCFTRNAFCAAPVTVARTASGRRQPALPGDQHRQRQRWHAGRPDAEASCRSLAERPAAVPEEVPFSTGVIGEPLPLFRLVTGLPEALATRPDGWDAAAGIMTTDTRPKWASRRLTLAGREVTITGIAKGAGMIRPDMATMLAFVATDAAVDPALLQEILHEAVADSFNAITVDGDTSTNDACLLLATGRSGVKRCRRRAATAPFRHGGERAMRRTGAGHRPRRRGATKFITVRVEGAGRGRVPTGCLRSPTHHWSKPPSSPPIPIGVVSWRRWDDPAWMRLTWSG